ncbi:amino acid ABC transporter permease [Chitinasiproducens palmae]|uniref:Amino acid ABC transporter membrane protein 2, PAAT family n=1 Tax=Chitinasiproducens palmae TaxID=1770053 RepID=A0A1H2PLP0_9BURK|nr:amino acid ABC transporter permease [Chitinasiproducens palmae]SDV47359.1 amino acid ABC transporter membrane protein 2, PAAT family [Chitinasiproducens palmae]
MPDYLWHALPYLLLGAFPDGPLGGAALTLLLAVCSALGSALIGFVAGVALAMSRGLVHVTILAVIGFFRAIPVLLLIFWTFFVLPLLLHVDLPSQPTVVVALSFVGGAYLAHAVHAGIVAVSAGQWQAALSLGLTRRQALRFIIMPQALRIMIPSFVNQWVALIKDTSLAYIVGVPELSFLANQVNSRLMVHPVEIFLFVALLYFALCTGLGWGAARLLERAAGDGSRSASRGVTGS